MRKSTVIVVPVQEIQQKTVQEKPGGVVRRV